MLRYKVLAHLHRTGPRRAVLVVGLLSGAGIAITESLGVGAERLLIVPNTLATSTYVIVNARRRDPAARARAYRRRSGHRPVRCRALIRRAESGHRVRCCRSRDPLSKV